MIDVAGLGGLSACLEEPEVFKYKDIPGFPLSTVAGHAGELVFGKLNDVEVVCMRGRFHFYEGYPPQVVAFPVRVMRLLGVQALIVTNACGGLNPDFNVGDVMIIKDHLALPCMAGNNPLMGPNVNELGDRFIPITDIYDPKILDLMKGAAKEAGHAEGLR